MVSYKCFSSSLDVLYRFFAFSNITQESLGAVRAESVPIHCSLSGSDGKESACNAGDLGMILGQKDPLDEAMATAPVFLAGEFHGQRSLVGYGPCDHKSRTWLNSFHSSLKAPKCLFPGIILARPIPKQPTKAAGEPWPYLPYTPPYLPPLCPSQIVFTSSRLRSSAGLLQARRANNPQPRAIALFVREFPTVLCKFMYTSTSQMPSLLVTRSSCIWVCSHLSWIAKHFWM